jgi:hypothetical protein
MTWGRPVRHVYAEIARETGPRTGIAVTAKKQGMLVGLSVPGLTTFNLFASPVYMILRNPALKVPRLRGEAADFSSGALAKRDPGR